MPASYAEPTGNGSTQTFSVPFPYILRAHVKLYTGYDMVTGTFATQLTEGTDYTWTSGTQVQTTVAPANGVKLTILRDTPANALLTQWQDGSALIAEDLITSDLQNLYVVQEQQDRNAAVAAQQASTTALANATAAAVANVLLYDTVANVAGIPAAPANNARVEVLDSTGIESFTPLAGMPNGFVGSSQLKVRLTYTTSGATWNWVDYVAGDPDGRYVRQSQISSSTTSGSTTNAANSAAVKTAKDAADAAQADATQALSDAAAAQGDATQALSDAAAAQGTADAAMPKSGGTFTNGITVPSLNGGPLAGMRNRIINGAMAVDQRNLGAAQSLSPGGKYTVDRWIVNASGGTVTGQRITGASANQFRYRITGAAGVTGINFAQRIETFNSADLAGQTVTISVDLANSVLTSVTWTLERPNVDDNYSGLTTLATGSWTVSSTIGRYTAQVSVPASATTGLQLKFSVGAQTSGTWTIGDAQLEPGSVATPFERRSYGLELALCQRYYWEGAHSVYSHGPSTTNVMMVAYPVHMRSAPTASSTASVATNVSSFSISNLLATGARSVLNSNATGSAEWTGTIRLSAEL